MTNVQRFTQAIKNNKDSFETTTGETFILTGDYFADYHEAFKLDNTESKSTGPKFAYNS